MKRWSSLALFLALSLGGGLLVSARNMPDGWYRALAKPVFNPPDWVFAPAWTVLYVLVAVAGWRVWRSGHRNALAAWGAQMALNFLWSPLFFAAHATFAALLVILALFAAILVFLAITAPRDRVAFWCFVPYAVWVAYATLLNGSIWWLNA